MDSLNLTRFAAVALPRFAKTRRHFKKEPNLQGKSVAIGIGSRGIAKSLSTSGNIEAVFVTTDKKIYVTDGLKDNFKFYDESNEYQYFK